MPPAAERRKRLHPMFSSLASGLALPLGAAYALFMRARRTAFERGLRSSLPCKAPCVSVGNISMGGNGKTPLTSWLQAWARERGLTAVALSRGYGGKPPHLPCLVTPQSSWRETGDEPLLLARSTTHAIVVVDPRRVRSCPWAEERFAPDLILMDDGMQHLHLRRDLDLVLMTPRDLLHDWNRVFPSGRWREGASALNRAHAFLIKADQNQFTTLAPQISKRLDRFQAPVFGFELSPQRFDAMAGPPIDTDAAHQPYILATAVADNQGVTRAASAFMQRPPERVLAWRDHHAFSQDDAHAMQQAAQAENARLILCTPKDAVKLAELEWHTPLAALVPEVRFLPGPDTGSFPEWWDATWLKLKERKSHGAEKTTPLG